MRPLLTVVAQWVPHEAIEHAGGRLLLRWVEGLCTIAEVRLVVPDLAHNDGLAGACPVPVHAFPVDRRAVDGWRRLASLPLEVAAGVHPGRHIARGLLGDPVARAWLRSSDLVEVQWTEHLPIVLRSLDGCPPPRPPVTLFVHDVLAQRHASRAASAPEPGLRALSRVWARTAARREARLVDRAAHVVALSDKDAAMLRAVGASPRVTVVPPPVAAPPAVGAPPADGSLLFVGDLSRPENREGLDWFVREVWPEVRRRAPSATLRVAGAGAAGAGAAGAGVVAVGFVDDLALEYRCARAVVAPVLRGAGVKVKVVEALAHGREVVTTTVGAEGVVERIGAGGPAAVEDDPLRFAAAVVRALGPAADRRGRAARAAWDRHLDPAGPTAEVLAAYVRLMSQS